jgi:hypothetical protein
MIVPSGQLLSNLNKKAKKYACQYELLGTLSQKRIRNNAGIQVFVS